MENAIEVHSDADGTRMALGVLSHDPNTGISFHWSPEALAENMQWSPLKCPLSETPWKAPSHETDLWGLPGFIHDALPDGWGLRVAGLFHPDLSPPPKQPHPFGLLVALSHRSWGALQFLPGRESDVFSLGAEGLKSLSEEAKALDLEILSEVSERLFAASLVPQGAKPKVMVAINQEASSALVGQEYLPEGFRHVLIKFSSDNEDPTHPALEFAYGEAARGLGINTAPAQLLTVAGRPALCVDRFDRQNGQRQHVHSMAGMLHITHRVANADWGHVAHILKSLPGGQADREEAFDRAVFNAVFCVRDDHTKNIAFIRHPDGTWGLSPAFDLAYSEGPGGYHTLTYARHRGQNVTQADLQRLAGEFDVDPASVANRIARATEARRHMLVEAKALGVSKRILTLTARRFSGIDQALKPASRKPKPSA